MTTLNPMLLKALATSGQGGVSPQEMLLSQLGENNSNVAMLSQLLSTSTETDDDEDLDDEFDEDEADIESELARDYDEKVRTLAAYEEKYDQLAAVAQQLKSKLQDAYAELEDLRDRNDEIAEALGACHLCWGEDLDCEVCRGDGYPGFFQPDTDMFRQYVTPATRRLQQRPKARQSASPAT